MKTGWKLVLSIIIVIFVLSTAVIIPFNLPDFSFSRGGDGFWWGVGYAISLFGLDFLILWSLELVFLEVKERIDNGYWIAAGSAILALFISTVTFCNQYEKLDTSLVADLPGSVHSFMPEGKDSLVKETVIVPEVWLQKVGRARLEKLLVESRQKESAK